MGAGSGAFAPPQFVKNYFSGNYAKFGHFVNFSYIYMYFQAKMSCPSPQSRLSSHAYRAYNIMLHIQLLATLI